MEILTAKEIKMVSGGMTSPNEGISLTPVSAESGGFWRKYSSCFNLACDATKAVVSWTKKSIPEAIGGGVGSAIGASVGGMIGGPGGVAVGIIAGNVSGNAISNLIRK